MGIETILNKQQQWKIWLTHILYVLIFCITIIGIPFGQMHFRLAKQALSPFGKEVV